MSWNPFGEGAGNPFDSIVNAAVNVMSGGLIGYKDGKIDPLKGYITHGADEFMGGITGRNFQRAQANKEQDQIDEMKKQNAIQAANEQNTKMLKDYQASFTALASQTPGAGVGAARPVSGTKLGGTDTQNLLGV